jgi:hypothetical protein
MRSAGKSVAVITLRLCIKSRRKDLTDAAFAGDVPLTDYTAQWDSLALRSETFRSVREFAPSKFWIMISG